MPSPNTNPLTYNGYVAQVATLAVAGYFTPSTTTVINGVSYIGGVTYGGSLASPDTAFNDLIPQMLNYAELRIQRDLDLLTAQSSGSYTITSGSNQLSIPLSDFIIVQTVSINSGTAKIPLVPTTKEFLQNTYNDSSFTDVPKYFGVNTGDASNINLIIGPYSNQSYTASVIGTARVPSLYKYSTATDAGTATTFISTYLPDMLVQASMIYVSQYQRNFGPASNDPQMGTTYEMQYQTLLKGALEEEYRKRFEASAWSSTSHSPVATPVAG